MSSENIAQDQGGCGKSIREIVDLFLADRLAAGRSPATIRYYRETLDRFIRFADVSGHDDLGAAAEAWARSNYGSEHASEAYVCTNVRAVAVLVNFAASRGLYTGPVRLKCRMSLGAPKAIPLADLRRALPNLDGEAEVLVRLLIATGVRLGEALAIRWGDIDRRGVVTIRGKGGHYRRVVLSQRLRRRLVPAAATADPAARVFQMGRRWYQKRIRASAQMVGITASAHRLRHTYAAETIGRGAPLNAVQNLLGHTSPLMTLHYARLYGPEAIEVARKYSPEDRL